MYNADKGKTNLFGLALTITINNSYINFAIYTKLETVSDVQLNIMARGFGVHF